jgi:hypothetical protein
MTRRGARLADEDEATAERAPEARSAPPAPSLIELQRSAGNAAVARALARQPTAGAPLQLPGASPPSLLGGPNPLLTYLPQLDPAVEAAVDRWLRGQAAGFRVSLLDGSISMPEVLDRVRRSVPEAASASAEAIRGRVIEIVGVIPEVRGKKDLAGERAQQQARISNMFPTPPTSVTWGGSQNSITIGINGADIKAAPGGAHVTAKAGKEGAEAELQQGDAKVGASGKWDGSEFALKTQVGPVKFDSKVHRKGTGWGWTGGLVIQLAGAEVDELPDVSGAVSGANAAITESLGYLQGGGSPTDAFVRDRMAKIKPAIDAVGQVAARKPGATLRVTGSADSAGWSAGVSLVIVF